MKKILCHDWRYEAPWEGASDLSAWYLESLDGKTLGAVVRYRNNKMIAWLRNLFGYYNYGYTIATAFVYYGLITKVSTLEIAKQKLLDEVNGKIVPQRLINLQ